MRAKCTESKWQLYTVRVIAFVCVCVCVGVPVWLVYVMIVCRVVAAGGIACVRVAGEVADGYVWGRGARRADFRLRVCGRMCTQCERA